MKLLKALNQHLYPSQSQHSQKIEEYFGKDNIINNTQQHKFLESIEITFICFINRSGSTLLTELMSNHGYPTMKFLEPFNYDHVIKRSKESNITSFSEYLYNLVKENSVNNKLALKIANNQLFWLSKNGFLSQFSKVNFIYAKRKDILKQAISMVIALQTSKWLSFEKYEISEEKQTELLSEITNKTILGCVRGVTQSYALFDYFFSLHNIQPIVIYYEDIVENKQLTIERCFNYLKFPYSTNSVKPTLMKTQYTDLNKKLEMRFRKKFDLFNQSSVIKL
ncbi:MAG: hypothetical protein F6K24_30335 [Okeania sp. SIO2D1]|nr:hypothetical protein [Okeania sp. SIO2D1]